MTSVPRTQGVLCKKSPVIIKTSGNHIYVVNLSIEP